MATGSKHTRASHTTAGSRFRTGDSGSKACKSASRYCGCRDCPFDGEADSTDASESADSSAHVGRCACACLCRERRAGTTGASGARTAIAWRIRAQDSGEKTTAIASTNFRQEKKAAIEAAFLVFRK
jgi:hypothetical protein